VNTAIDLTSYAIAWVVAVCVIIILAIYRYMVANKEDDTVHISDVDRDGAVLARQSSLAKKLENIDRLGKALTVLAAVSGLVLLGVYFYNVWNTSW
jgi:short subunit fatty acids transporter